MDSFRRLTMMVLMALVCSATWAKGTGPDDTEVKRPKIGLVLGGGGAKGAAEVGVLKYIEQAGVHIDYIAGTSIGSIIGALYSVGYRAEDLDSLFHSQQWLSLLADRNMEHSSQIISKSDSTLYIFGFPIKRPRITAPNHTKTFGLSRGDSLVSLFADMTQLPDTIDFDSLPIPFRCVSVDLRTFSEVVMHDGSLPLAMRASMAIPGVFKPVEVDDMLLVDGGLMNNLPVDVVRDMGADVVIAIDLTQNKHTSRRQKEPDDDDASGRQLKRLLQWAFDRPDIDRYRENSAHADVYINPDLKGFSAADFTPRKIAQMIVQGEKAGKAAMKQLEKLKTDNR